VVLLVDHDEFDMQLVADHATYVLDTRRCVPPGDNVETL
jgi:UDP-N-acetyl-D-glucosamine dehydrogenase